MFSDKAADHSVQDQINYWPSAMRPVLLRALYGEHLRHNLGSAAANVKATARTKPPL